MQTILDPTLDQHFRNLLTNSICRLAAKMPYCNEEDAREELRHLTDNCGHGWLYRVTGVSTAQQLIDLAIKVRAAAEEAAA